MEEAVCDWGGGLRVARAFKDVQLNEKLPTESYWNIMYLTQVKAFFSPLFQLLPIISFLAPPLSKLHVIFTVSKSNRSGVSSNMFITKRRVGQEYTLVA